ncbi:hypothetical protein KIN20_006331, partial [Parelaphostrongylus tenuis]
MQRRAPLTTAPYALFTKPSPGYFAYVGKRVAVVFLCIFHFWHSWCSTLGGSFTKSMCDQFTKNRVRKSECTIQQCEIKP